MPMPQIMGILNVTDDSFSDGGKYPTVDAAVSAGLKMVEEGASIIDVGGESTRPGSSPVGLEEELRRVLPVVEKLVGWGVYVSVDTSKPRVAREALAAGAGMINDVTGFQNPQMFEVCAESDCKVVIMHMQGDPRTMQLNPLYEDVVEEVRSFLVRQAAMVGEQIDQSRIVLDPGIGFGKTVQHNLALVKEIEELVDLGYEVMLGVSRKGFIGKVLNPVSPVSVEERLEGTLAIHLYAQLKGVTYFRTHDVLSAVKAARALSAVLEVSL